MGAAVPQELIATNVPAAKLLDEEPLESSSRSAQLGSVGDGFEAAEAPDHGSEAVEVQDKQEAANPAAGYQILDGEQEGGSEAAGSAGESKGPVIGGPSPSEASSVWPEDVGSGGKTTVAAAPQSQTFSVYYLVKIPRRPANATELAATDSQLRDKTDKRDKISEAFQKKRAEKFEIIEKLKEKRTTLRSCVDAAKQKGDELARVQQELDGMKGDPKYCRSEKELDARIRELDDVLQHESLDIKEERKIVRQIKDLKSTRAKVQENELAYGDSRREDLAERRDHLQKEVKELRERRATAYSSVAVLEEELKAVNAVLDDLSRQREVAEDARNGVYEKRRSLNEQQYAANDDFFQNRRDIALARQYGATGQKAALEEFSNRQVEDFMEKWNNDPDFRADYIKCNEQSTLRRFRTLDARLLGPDETPVSLPEASKPSIAAQPPVKPQEEHAPVPPVVEAKPRQKVVEDLPPVVAPEPVKKGPEDEEAEALAQERRRQEEMEKRKEAEARKKRIAERKQAKAEVRSQREALEKEKKKQKKMQKKAGPSEETANENNDVAEVDGVQENGTIHQEETPAAAAPAAKAALRAAVKPVFRPPTRTRALPRRRRRQAWMDWLQDWRVIGAIVVVFLAAMAVIGVYVSQRQAAAVTH